MKRSELRRLIREELLREQNEEVYYIEVDSPRQVKSKRVQREVITLMKQGVLSRNIRLRTSYVEGDNVSAKAFQVVKNHAAFAVRNGRV